MQVVHRMASFFNFASEPFRPTEKLRRFEWTLFEWIFFVCIRLFVSNSFGDAQGVQWQRTMILQCRTFCSTRQARTSVVRSQEEQGFCWIWIDMVVVDM